MELCYTFTMTENNLHIWRTWAQSLYRWGLDDMFASLLEAAGPLTLLAAQVIYIGQPLFGHDRLNMSMTSLADMLETSDNTQMFIKLLREEPQRESA